MKKKVLITGAGGFVGANLARRTLELGHELHLLTRPGFTRWRLEDVLGDCVLHDADMEDAGTVRAAVREARPDWVFHLAAYGAYSWQADHARIMRVNAAGTAVLLDACLEAGFESFVNAGSSSEYGAKDHPPREDEVLEPNSCYAVSKAAASHYCRHVSLSRDVNAVTLRLYSVYGPWEEPGRFIPALILSGLSGEYPRLADPGTARDYVHSSDVCEAFFLAASRPSPRGSVYNVGTGRQTTLREAAAAAGEVFGIKKDPEWGGMPGRSWDTSSWVADISKIRRELGWSPSLDFKTGLADAAEWFRGRPALHGFYRDGHIRRSSGGGK